MYLEVHGNGRSIPLLLLARSQEIDFRRDLRFLAAAHALDPAATDFAFSSK